MKHKTNLAVLMAIGTALSVIQVQCHSDFNGPCQGSLRGTIVDQRHEV